MKLLTHAVLNDPRAASSRATGVGCSWARMPPLGTLSAGKAAHLLVIAGNPGQQIEAIENIETVLKDGLGYDPKSCCSQFGA